MTPIRLLVALLAVVVTSSAPAADPDTKALAIGGAAPMRDALLKNTDGRQITIAEAAGTKGTLVVFTCNHCPWVKMWQKRIARVGNAAIGRGVGVIAINSNDPSAFPEDDLEGMKARAKQLGLRFPYVMDETSDVARAFGATRTPEAYLFDAQGKLVYHGTVDDNARDERAVQQSWLKQAVEAVASGRTVPTAETKALGCSIKLREDVGE